MDYKLRSILLMSDRIEQKIKALKLKSPKDKGLSYIILLHLCKNNTRERGFRFQSNFAEAVFQEILEISLKHKFRLRNIPILASSYVVIICGQSYTNWSMIVEYCACDEI